MSGRSTSGPTRALSSSDPLAVVMGRAANGIRIAALLVFLAAAACGDGATKPPTATPTVAPSPTPPPPPAPTEASPAAEEPPDRDLFDLAVRFRGLPANAPRTARQTPYAYQVGDRQEITILHLNPPPPNTI